ncbi:hypothetical protein NPIL_284881 [Nephila pilipes]|uniref:Uncharacterized protein n=1 Tax=Nephila pilipes TaxID=299642 RepID=A0A8X6UJH1_NEPPI|nr:hypothetical protein NPIL_284881 [Nephila pilipes]
MKSQKDIMKLADFRTELADTLCRHQSRLENKKKGRQSAKSRREETPEPFKRPRPQTFYLRKLVNSITWNIIPNSQRMFSIFPGKTIWSLTHCPE